MDLAGSLTTPYDGLGTEQRHALTAELFVQVAGAEGEERTELLDQVILLNVPIARSIAGRFRGKGVPSDDLEQVANTALVRAVHNFDPSQGTDFLAYATPSIRGELRRYFRDHGWVVRPPRRIQELRPRVVEASEQIQADEHRIPSAAEIAVALAEPVEDVVEALGAHDCFAPASLDSETAGGDSSTAVPDPAAQQHHETAETWAMLGPALRQLSEQDRRLLWLRFREEFSQHEIAVEFGVSQTQISRLLNRTLRHLQLSIGALDSA